MIGTGTVYKISTPKNDKVYIGSTTQKLNIRLSQHKCNKNCMAQQLLELGECKIEALEVLYNITKEELRIKEQHYLELLKELSVNKHRSFNNQQQHKDMKKESHKKWFIKKSQDDNFVQKEKERVKAASLDYYHKKMQDPEFRKKKAEEARLKRQQKKYEKECLVKNMEESL